MRRAFLLLTLVAATVFACAGLVFAQQEEPANAKNAKNAKQDVILDNYIVVLKEKEKPNEVSQEHAAKHGAKVKHVYEHALKGYSAEISADKLEKVKADKRVLFVSEDREVEAFAQSVPTGIKRIGIDPSDTTKTNKGSGVGVAVIDTGIDLDHPDLNVSQPSRDSSGNWTNGKNCRSTALPDDDNGHGTHVAGTIAASNNDTGVIGVAPEVALYAVKVLDSGGSGSWSNVICGVDYVSSTRINADGSQEANPDNDIHVANMSLGGSGSDDANCGDSNSDALHKAICNSVNKAKVTYAVAAGNNSGTDLATKVPAAYDEALTVTALADFNGSPGGGADETCREDEDDTAANFSNMATSTADQNHTIAAPGVCINSTWMNGGYNTISGTSMATPHAAGTAALYLATNQSATPAEVISKLREDAASHSGTDPEVDNYYGFKGDPNQPNGSRYYGYLEWPDSYLSGGTNPPPSDTSAPTVSNTSPADGAGSIALNTNVTATFSEDMDPATLTTETFKLVKDGSTTQIGATVSYDAATKTATLDPSGDLEASTKYVATVTTGAKDKVSNALAAEKVWSFTTTTSSSSGDTTAPNVTSTSPAGGKTGVGRDTNVLATFSEDIDGATVDTFMLAQGTTAPTTTTKITSGTTVSYDPATKTAKLNPYGSAEANLKRCTWYTAKVTSGVKDKAGNPAVEKVWSFKTKGC